MKKLVKHTIFLLITATSIKLLNSCSSSEQTPNDEIASENKVTLTQEQSKNLKIETMALSEQTIQGVVELNGKVESPLSAKYDVHSPIAGRISGCNLFTGQKVSKGQVLAYIEDLQIVDLQQRYLSAVNNYELATIESVRQKELIDEDAGSKKNLQLAENKKKAFAFEIAAYGKQLEVLGISPSSIRKGTITSKIPLRSPISGFVTELNLQNGAFYTAEQHLITIQNVEQSYISLNGFSGKENLLASGLFVDIKRVEDTNFTLRGQIFLVNKSFTDGGKIEVHVKPIGEMKWLPGTVVNARVLLPAKKGFAMPKNAVTEYEDKQFCWVKVGKNSYEMIPITTGIETPEFIEIKNPEVLKGRKVVTKGAYGLYMTLKNKEEG